MATVKFSDVVKKFDGTGDVSKWLEKIELVAKLQKIDDVASMIPLFLDGSAFDVYQQLCDTDKQSVESVKTALVKSFGFTASQAWAMFKVRRLQVSEAPDAYLADLRRLASVIGYDGEAANALVACQFVDGLPEPCRSQVKALHSGSLDIPVLLECAKGILLEQDFSGGYAAMPRNRLYKNDVENNRGSQAFGKRCYGCNRLGHYQRDCTVECFLCKSRGHVRSRCPQMQRYSENDSGEAPTAPGPSPTQKS